MRGCEAIENFSDAVFHADSVVHRCFRRRCSVFLLSIRSLSVDLQASHFPVSPVRDSLS